MEEYKNIDQVALKKLKAKGLVIEGEQNVDFYFYFPNEFQAHQAGAALQNLQFKTQVYFSKYGNNWLCLAKKNITVSSRRLTELRKWMEDLADRYEGEYDGWETMVDLEGD